MAIDWCQPQVERALQKDGWTVTASPRHFAIGEESYFIDLELMKDDNTTQDQAKTRYIEVKCLPIGSSRAELYIALGQYTIYAEVLRKLKNPASLYLAIPESAWERVFNEIVRQSLNRISAKIVIVDLEKEQVRQWIVY